MRISGGPSWSFIPTDWVFRNWRDPFYPACPSERFLPGISEDAVNQDFTGLKLGDLDNSYIPDGASPPPHHPDTLSLLLEDRTVQAGTLVQLPVRAVNFDRISGFQLGLAFDPDLLTFEGMSTGDLPGLDPTNFGTREKSTGQISIVWHDRESLQDGQSFSPESILFYLNFRARADWNSLRHVIGQSNTITPACSADASGRRGNVAIRVLPGSLTKITEPVTRLLAESPRPNPFRDRVKIPVFQNANGVLHLTLTDMSGRLIRIWTEEMPSGSSLLEINGNDLPGPGMYLLRIKEKYREATRKLIYLP